MMQGPRPVKGVRKTELLVFNHLRGGEGGNIFEML